MHTSVSSPRRDTDHLKTYRENYTWLCISQWERLCPRPQSHRQTLRRWPARDQECFHPSALHRGCRHKGRNCVSCRRTQPSLGRERRVTYGCHVPRYYWMCEFCSAGSPHVRLPRPARPRSAEKDIAIQSRCIYTAYRPMLAWMASRMGDGIFKKKWKLKV